MYKFSMRGKSVNIELDPGVYVFDCVTSSGKTFLCNMLKQFKTVGQPVGGYTYTDVLDGRSLQDYVGNNKFTCLVVDRYDMYNGDYDEYLDELANSGCIVLVDCKYKSGLNFEYDLASIELSEGKVRVY